jgi:hypothetical protein
MDDASVTSTNIEDDKTMAMMGLAKTIEAVKYFHYDGEPAVLTGYARLSTRWRVWTQSLWM